MPAFDLTQRHKKCAMGNKNRTNSIPVSIIITRLVKLGGGSLGPKLGGRDLATCGLQTTDFHAISGTVFQSTDKHPLRHKRTWYSVQQAMQAQFSLHDGTRH